MSTENLWRQYHGAAIEKEGNTDQVLCRAVFTNVFNAFTRAERKRKEWVYYVLAAFIYDYVADVARLVEGEVVKLVQRKTFLSQLRGIEDYLRFSFVTHLGVH